MSHLVKVLAFIVGDRVLPFPSESFLLGSGAGCALRFSQLEPRHAEVFFEDDAWQIRDISGLSTMRVNGASTLEAKIADGSHLKARSAEALRPGQPRGRAGAGSDLHPHRRPPARQWAGDRRALPGARQDRRRRNGSGLLVEHLELGKNSR